MAWFLIVMLTLIVLGALLGVLVLAARLAEGTEDERLRIDMEVRRAERRLHDIASNTFRSMLDEARDHDPKWVK
jgi:hypothetical protein